MYSTHMCACVCCSSIHALLLTNLENTANQRAVPMETDAPYACVQLLVCNSLL